MKLAVMQPYFLPYVGYFQLVAAVDEWIIYDNIKYTKKGWINRNRLLQNGKDVKFGLPLKNASDFLTIGQRELTAEFDKRKFLNLFAEAYRRAPQFEPTFSLLEQIVHFKDRNLFGFLHHSIASLCDFLSIPTQITVSSTVPIDHDLTGQDKVLSFCKQKQATQYINAIGGVELYRREDFHANQVDLRFLKTRPIAYQQFDNEFVPWLSIIDVLMFNPVSVVKGFVLNDFELI